MPAELISIEEARETVLLATRQLAHESVEVAHALDRVLAEDVVAAGDVPPFDCSAMDGYALTAGPAERALTVIDESRAGAPAGKRVTDTEAIRISTGAAVPAGATAVIRQEDVEDHGALIETQEAVSSGENIRRAGEDMIAGETVLKAETLLRAAELGAAVAAGVARVTVTRRPIVAIFCTGDELRAPGEALGPGEIHNSNAPMLAALTERCGAVALAPQRLADDRHATEAALAKALEIADAIVISGGVSVGPHDHVKPALAALGVREQFWGVALQPGRPTWFGTRDAQLVFGLPGNPVSCVVTFSLFARAALAAMQGLTLEEPVVSEAILATPVRRNSRREQAVRVRLERRDSAVVAIPNGPQGSHLVTSLLGADALALIPAGEGELEAGAVVALEELLL